MYILWPHRRASATWTIFKYIGNICLIFKYIQIYQAGLSNLGSFVIWSDSPRVVPPPTRPSPVFRPSRRWSRWCPCCCNGWWMIYPTIADGYKTYYLQGGQSELRQKQPPTSNSSCCHILPPLAFVPLATACKACQFYKSKVISIFAPAACVLLLFGKLFDFCLFVRGILPRSTLCHCLAQLPKLKFIEIHWKYCESSRVSKFC